MTVALNYPLSLSKVRYRQRYLAEKKRTIRVPSREDAAQTAGVVASSKSISVLVLATLSIPCGEQLVSRGRPRKIEP